MTFTNKTNLYRGAVMGTMGAAVFVLSMLLMRQCTLAECDDNRDNKCRGTNKKEWRTPSCNTVIYNIDIKSPCPAPAAVKKPAPNKPAQKPKTEPTPEPKTEPVVIRDTVVVQAPVTTEPTPQESAAFHMRLRISQGR